MTQGSAATQSGSPASVDGAAPSDAAAAAGAGVGLFSQPATTPLPPSPLSRLEKRAIVVRQLGGADESTLFGSADSAVMRAYREWRVPDLLVINRPEDDASRHPLVWYKPWTWFTAGPQVSPMVWAPRDDQRPAAPPVAAPARPSAAAETQTDAPAPVVLRAVAAAVAPAERKKKLKAGLPPVVLEALPDAVVEELTDQVRSDREKLLKSEQHIHSVLQGIEDTRYKYLVPSQDFSCEYEVGQVIRCYQKQNAAAEKKRAAVMQQRQKELEKGFSNRMDEGDLHVPIVALDALLCGPAVDALKKCTAQMTSAYSEGALS